MNPDVNYEAGRQETLDNLQVSLIVKALRIWYCAWNTLCPLRGHFQTILNLTRNYLNQYFRSRLRMVSSASWAEWHIAARPQPSLRLVDLGLWKTCLDSRAIFQYRLNYLKLNQTRKLPEFENSPNITKTRKNRQIDRVKIMVHFIFPSASSSYYTNFSSNQFDDFFRHSRLLCTG